MNPPASAAPEPAQATAPSGRAAALAAATAAAYERVHQESFLGDPAANPRLPVEVVAVQDVAGWPVLVLLTPWTLNGLIFPPSGAADSAGELPRTLDVAGRERPVFPITMPDLDRHGSVNLVGDVSRWTSPEQARTVARSMVAPFVAAVTAAREGPAGTGPPTP